MKETSSAAQQLKALRERAGISSRELARRIGRVHSSYMHYEDIYKKTYLPIDFVQEIRPHLEAAGIDRSEIMALGGIDTELPIGPDESPDNCGILAENVRARMLAIGMTPKELSQKSGLDPVSLAAVLDGAWRTPAGRPPTITTPIVISLARLFTCRPKDLLTPLHIDNQPDLPAGLENTESKPPALSPGYFDLGGTEYVALGRYDIGLSAGPGSLVDPYAQPIGYHVVERRWIEMMTNVAPEHLFVARVDNDSMVPALNPGDWVLGDRSQAKVGKEGIFAIQVFDDTWVKRLSPDPQRNIVQIISDNKNYPIKEWAIDDVRVIGRILAVVMRRLI